MTEYFDVVDENLANGVGSCPTAPRVTFEDAKIPSFRGYQPADAGVIVDSLGTEGAIESTDCRAVA